MCACRKNHQRITNKQQDPQSAASNNVKMPCRGREEKRDYDEIILFAYFVSVTYRLRTFCGRSNVLGSLLLKSLS